MTDEVPNDKIDKEMSDAIERFVRATKEELAEQHHAADELLHEGEAQQTLFRGKEIRQVFHEDEWYFSIIDVIHAVTGSDRPRQYWSDLKSQLSEKEGFDELSDKIVQLPMLASDGKQRETDAVNTETLFRIVQSISSKAAEPFKRWLAKTGYERIQEIQNPEIAIKRAMLGYRAQGRSDEWIHARIQTISSRKELVREWKKRGVRGEQYAILTDVISRATFGIGVKDHKEHKGLKSQNLRDHMTPIELALTMLGETTTSEIARTTDAQGFQQNENAARSGGAAAGAARKDVERRIGRPILSKQNFLPKSEQKKLP